MTESLSGGREHKIGPVLDGRIKLAGVIGSGAYGVVYCAVNIETGVRLAVKALPKQLPNYNASWSSAEPSPTTPRQRPLKRRRGSSGEAVESTDEVCISVRSVPLKDMIERYDRMLKQQHCKSSLLTLSASKLNPGELACREIALHAKVHTHPFIVSIHEVLESSDMLYMVLEHFERGDLFRAITESKLFVHQDAQIRVIFTQLLDAVAYCHSKGVYHCDLKPENILISTDGKSIRLADFGLATSQSFSIDFGYGSSFYMSPERLIKTPTEISTEHLRSGWPKVFSTSSSDVWALGVILLNLCCGRNPWKKASLGDDPSFRAFIRDARFLEKIMPITSQLNEVLRKAFDLSSTRRLTVTQFRNLLANCPMVRPRLNKSISCPGFSVRTGGQSLPPGFHSIQANPVRGVGESIAPSSVYGFGLSSPHSFAPNSLSTVVSPLPHRPLPRQAVFHSSLAASPLSSPYNHSHPHQLLPPLPVHSTAGSCHACEQSEHVSSNGLLSPPASEIASTPVTPEQQVLWTPGTRCQRQIKRARTTRVPLTPL